MHKKHRYGAEKEKSLRFTASMIYGVGNDALAEAMKTFMKGACSENSAFDNGYGRLAAEAASILEKMHAMFQNEDDFELHVDEFNNVEGVDIWKALVPCLIDGQ